MVQMNTCSDPQPPNLGGTEYVIIVAGGKGLRMGGDIPKQFLPVGGRPVLMRTMERFREYSADLKIILVLPHEQQDYWRYLCRQYQFPLPPTSHLSPPTSHPSPPYRLADGGETRFHSVQHGLALIPDDEDGMVGVHDGVRPFVSVEVIRRCYETARRAKAVVPVIPVVETLREMGSFPPSFAGEGPGVGASRTVPRDRYRLVQTPQVFDIQLLKAANCQPYTPAFTDDASVAEAYGQVVTLVDGNRENIKLTTPFDLKIAETLL